MRVCVGSTCTISGSNLVHVAWVWAGHAGKLYRPDVQPPCRLLSSQVILPELGVADVLVQVRACALTRIDTKVPQLTNHILHSQEKPALSLQTISELSPSLEQIPVGHHISGVVSKGTRSSRQHRIEVVLLRGGI